MRTLHKTAALALALGMMFTSVPMSVSANTATVASGDLTEEQVVEKVKQFITLPKGVTLSNVSYSERGFGPYSTKSIWQLSFTNKDDRTSGWVSATVDAKTGQLLAMEIVDQDDTAFDKMISREAAREIAVAYAKKAAGDKLGSTKEIEEVQLPNYDVNNRQQDFRFVRMVDGVPYPADGISVEVSPDGTVRGYSYTWSEELKFPKATPTITVEKALQAYQEALNIDLQYTRVRKQFAKQDSLQLVYKIDTQYNSAEVAMIDAEQGVAIGTDGKPAKAPIKNDWKPLADKASGTLKQNVTKDEALQVVSGLKLVPADFKLESANYVSHNEQKSWRFEFSTGDQESKNYRYLSVAVNAVTGELLSLFGYDNERAGSKFPANPTFSTEQARQKAIDFVKAVWPTRIDKLAMPTANITDSKSGPGYSFSFVHLLDGLPTAENSIRVMIDPTTGNVIDVNMDLPVDIKNFKDYPNKAKAMTMDAAKAKFLAKNKLELQYAPIFETGKSAWDSMPVGVKLVYAPTGAFVHLDAISGEWTLPYGAEPAERAPVTDIKGHWAEKQLQFFTDRGVFAAKDGKVAPDEEVTRGDMIRYMLLSLNGPRLKAEKSTYKDVAQSSSNFEYIEEAVARKWLDKNEENFRPDDAITRAELAELITTSLGYKTLSEADGTFKNRFSDVTESNKRYYGDISVISALGIMGGTDGKFNPDQHVTKAQVAVVLTRVLDQYRNSIINF